MRQSGIHTIGDFYDAVSKFDPGASKKTVALVSAKLMYILVNATLNKGSGLASCSPLQKINMLKEQKIRPVELRPDRRLADDEIFLMRPRGRMK